MVYLHFGINETTLQILVSFLYAMKMDIPLCCYMQRKGKVNTNMLQSSCLQRD